MLSAALWQVQLLCSKAAVSKVVPTWYYPFFSKTIQNMGTLTFAAPSHSMVFMAFGAMCKTVA